MRTIIIGILLAVAVAPTGAATWHVAQDGSGDFTVIQDAVDAASDGDTIWVHAGRYTEVTEYIDRWGDVADVHVLVDKNDLTLKGDGQGVTFIGPDVPPTDLNNSLHGIAVGQAVTSTLRVVDLTVENVRLGVVAENDRCEIESCDFLENRLTGVWLITPGGASVVGCRFTGTVDGLVAQWPAENVEVSDCEMNCNAYGMLFKTVLGVVVDSCTFDGPNVGLNSQFGANVTLNDCVISGSADHNVGVDVVLGAQAYLNGCTIMGFEVGAMIRSGGTGELIINDSTIAGSSAYGIWIKHGLVEVHDSQIFNGGIYNVVCDQSSTTDCHVNMTNNYWGTESEELIAASIYDAADDPELCCTVDFVPFQGLVATESHSWTDVKGLFRDGE